MLIPWLGCSPMTVPITGPIHFRESQEPRPVDRSGPATCRTEFSSLLTLKTGSRKKTLFRSEARVEIHRSVATAARKYDLPPALILAVIQQESGGRPSAESQCGAQGCMQLMPETAKAMGVSDPFDPAQNIDGGSRYLRKVLDQFGGNIEFALAAYNAGPQNVQKYGGIPPFEETQNYVPSVLAHFESLNGSPDLGGPRTLGITSISEDLISAVLSTSMAIHLPERRPSDEPPPPPSAIRV